MKYNDKAKRWGHADDCLHIYPLDTGCGFWHCSCGYAAYEELQEENAALRAALDEIITAVRDGGPLLPDNVVAHLHGAWDNDASAAELPY